MIFREGASEVGGLPKGDEGKREGDAGSADMRPERLIERSKERDLPERHVLVTRLSQSFFSLCAVERQQRLLTKMKREHSTGDNTNLPMKNPLSNPTQASPADRDRKTSGVARLFRSQKPMTHSVLGNNSTVAPTMHSARRLSAWMLAGACLLGLSSLAAAQESGALLDALVRKKVLSAQEAEDIRADLIQENAATSAGKIQLSSSVTELKLSGDLRLRYQYDNRRTTLQPPVADSGSLFNGHGEQRSRERFRLRLNAEFKLTDSIFGGVQLQTNNASDSGNQTFGTGFGNYNIYISRAFLGWNATDWLTLVAGKQANPFYTTDLVWDADINPEGLVESLQFHKLYQNLAYGDVRSDLPWELTLVAGQFIFFDNNEFLPDDAGKDVWLFNTQLIGSYKVTPNVKVTLAPGFMAYTPGNITGVVNETAFNNTAAVPHGASRNLAIITAPGDVSFKVAGVKTKVLWDFAYNTKGDKRGVETYGMTGDLAPVRKDGHIVGYTGGPEHKAQDNLAWLAGVQLGENKKKGDWSLIANYRRTGLTSVDPNLNDSDFALGQLNMQGFKVGGAYNLTDSCVIGATYFDARKMRDRVYNGQATKDNKLAYLDSVQIFQLDLNLKF